jgi:small subunit ribosomal protein S11
MPYTSYNKEYRMYEEIKNNVNPRIEKNKKLRVVYDVTMTLTNNNTFINLAETLHSYKKHITRTMTYLSGGKCGFKGSQKASTMANATIGEMAAIKFKKYGCKHMRLRIFGCGKRKNETIVNIAKQGLAIDVIKQETQRAHNGVRPKKIRRL